MTDLIAPAAPEATRRRPIVIGVAVLVVAALAALWLLVISPLLDDEPLQAAPPTDATPVPSAGDDAAVDATATAGEGVPTPRGSDVLAARDPFQQLVTDAPTASTITTAAATAPVAVPGDAGGQTTALPATRVGDTVVRVVEVGAVDGVTKATVTVNGERHTAAEGETFATSFTVLDIVGDCVTLRFGERRFTLCVGEQITK